MIFLKGKNGANSIGGQLSIIAKQKSIKLEIKLTIIGISFR
jgi:hypothetical protein